jgi:hypothetical protein
MPRALYGGLSAVMLLFFLSVVSCATFDNAELVFPEECCGVWINGSYNMQEKRAAKIIYHPDMTWSAYDTSSSTQPTWRGTISIIEKWTDDHGDIWYKVTTN